MCEFAKWLYETNQECNVCAEDFKKILISISTIIDQGLKVEFVRLGCLVKDTRDHYKVIVEGVRVGGLYKLDVTMNDNQASP